jgi:hypothetical protein
VNLRLSPLISQTHLCTGIKALGTCGAIHINVLDHLAAQMAMTWNNRLLLSGSGNPHDPGLFFVMLLRAYVTLDGISTTVFSGLFRHGGTPPCSLDPDQNPALDAVHLTLIAYPLRETMEGNHVLPTTQAPLADCPMMFTPEMVQGI